MYWCDINRCFNLPVSCDKISQNFHSISHDLDFFFHRYHIYKQNQNRLNNNNTIRVNLNQQAVQAAAQPRPDGQENNERSQNDRVDGEIEAEQSAAAAVPEEPPVPFSTVFRTFVISFFSSIIPEAPAL